MNPQLSEIVNYIKSATKGGKVIQRKVIASELNISEAHVSRIIGSGGTKGRLDQWLTMLDLCGFAINVENKRDKNAVTPNPENVPVEESPTHSKPPHQINRNNSIDRIQVNDPEQVAITIDNKLHNVTAWTEQLIALLRERNEELTRRNDLLLKALRKHLSESEIEKINELLIVNGGDKL